GLVRSGRRLGGSLGRGRPGGRSRAGRLGRFKRVRGRYFFFWRRGGCPGLHRGEAFHQLADLGEVLQAGDPAEGQLDQEAAVRAAPEATPGLGEDLEGGEDRVEPPAIRDPPQSL